MLPYALADLACRDEQELGRAAEGGLEGGRLVVVGLANLDPARGEVLGLLRVANGGGHLRCRHFREPMLDEQAAEVAQGRGADHLGGLLDWRKYPLPRPATIGSLAQRSIARGGSV